MMKSHIVILFGLLILSGCEQNSKADKENSAIKSTMDLKNKQLRHVVLFKFKDSTTQANIQKVEAAFEVLPSQIPEIKDFEWGLNNSPEDINKGFTHCFFLTFDSEEGRDVYLSHPAHKAFGEVLSPHLEDVLVLDYWVK